MGTLGCINDMMRRDKENRELRKAGKKRMDKTRYNLLKLTGKHRPTSDVSLEQLEQIHAEIKARKEWEQEYFFRGKLLFAIIIIAVLLAGGLIYLCVQPL